MSSSKCCIVLYTLKYFLLPQLNTEYIFHKMKAFSLSLFVALVEGFPNLRVESHTNNDTSFNMVSSLIIGSEAAVIINLPMAIL